MAIENAFSDLVPGGDATTPKIGDLSGVVTAGSTNADLRITNTGDYPCSFNWRDTGTTTWYQESLLPLQSVDKKLALTAARTFEYFFDASSLQVDVTYFWGTGLSSTVSLSDVTAWITMLGYTVSETGHLTSAEVQLCLNKVTAEVNTASTRYALIAMQTLDATLKNSTILTGSVAQALYVLRNVGATRGLTSDMIIISTETADRYNADYIQNLETIKQGFGV
jgi:hypothetical protein